jgi:hypothetical protein
MAQTYSIKSQGMAVADEKPQLEKFKDAARDLECDDDEERFKERLGKLVKAKPGEKTGE